MNNLITITIAGISIRQDIEGRYCLNDLHKASGSSPKNRPNYFLDRAETDDLRLALKESAIDGGVPEFRHRPPVMILKGGNYEQGTYVVKELVYAYAMWISPKFHLQVIRAYDQMVTAPASTPIAVTAPTTLLEALKQAVIQQEQLAEAQQVLAIAAPKAEVYDTVAVGGRTTLASFVQRLDGVDMMKTLNDLKNVGVVYRSTDGYRVYSAYRDSHFSEALEAQSGSRVFVVQPKGKNLLIRLYLKGKLTMREGSVPLHHR